MKKAATITARIAKNSERNIFPAMDLGVLPSGFLLKLSIIPHFINVNSKASRKNSLAINGISSIMYVLNPTSAILALASWLLWFEPQKSLAL